MGVEFGGDRLRALLTQVEALAGGDLHVRIPITSARDEVDSLAFAINILAEEIQYNLALAGKRSEELATALSQLEKSHNELRTTQDQLIQSARMAALGEFSAGLAHEVNNPLTVIRANVDKIDKLTQKKTLIASLELRKPLDQVNLAIDRTTKIIKHVRDFSTPQSTIGTLSLNHVVTSALDFVAIQLQAKGVELRLDLCLRAPVISGNQAQLEQVILNLIANASDAIENRGSPREDDRPGQIGIKSVGGTKESILIVSDNGCGIENSIIDNIYLPFFTTKEPARGIGIGLSLCHRILTSHGATIQCDSRVDTGTSFTIRFPAVNNPKRDD